MKSFYVVCGEVWFMLDGPDQVALIDMCEALGLELVTLCCSCAPGEDCCS